MTAGPTRRELRLLVDAWLEERELTGLDPAFRAAVSQLDADGARGVGSVEDLHALLDAFLAEAGLLGARGGPT